MNLQDILSSAFGAVRQRFQPQAAPQPISLPSPSPAPQNGLSEVDRLEQMMLEGYGRYGATPSAQAVRTMAENSQNYPIFKQYPFLAPSLSIVETGAGQNMTRPANSPNPQNLMNWGINPSLGFNPTTQEESVDRAMSGIGQRTPYYQKFRDTGSLNDFVDVYAPPSDGNEGYLEKLLRAGKYFEPGT